MVVQSSSSPRAQEIPNRAQLGGTFTLSGSLPPLPGKQVTILSNETIRNQLQTGKTLTEKCSIDLNALESHKG
jgi:hypothetical protein